MKAVILARGRGSRMSRPADDAALNERQAKAADAGHKVMMPFRAPFLDYVLSGLADAGIPDICIVVAPDDRAVRAHYVMHTPSRVHLTFALQEAPRGTADAVLAARSFTAGSSFLVLNGDNLYPESVYRALATVDGLALAAFRASALVRDSNIPAHRIRSFALLEVSSDGYLVDIVEKPSPEAMAALGNDPLVSMNCWRFDSTIFRACESVPPSSRGELELPEAVKLAIHHHGARFRAIAMETGAVIDLSERSDVAEVDRRLATIEPRP